MTETQMERQLENLDRRLARVEQILPTLATKTDLERFATKQDLERYATKEDLERFATKTDLVEGMAQQRALTESVREEVRALADSHWNLVRTVTAHEVTLNAVAHTLDTLVLRLEAKGVI
jgi:hypothetical protein